jgi:hypothetical protein
LTNTPTVDKSSISILSWRLRVSKAYMVYMIDRDSSAFFLINQALDLCSSNISVKDYEHLINICLKCSEINEIDCVTWLQVCLDAIEHASISNESKFSSFAKLEVNSF